MLAAVKHATRRFLADAIDINDAFAVKPGPSRQIVPLAFGALVLPAAAIAPVWILNLAIEDRKIFAPLFEEKRHTCSGALITQGAGPVRMHRTSFGPAFASANYPVYFARQITITAVSPAAWVESGKGVTIAVSPALRVKNRFAVYLLKGNEPEQWFA